MATEGSELFAAVITQHLAASAKAREERAARKAADRAEHRRRRKFGVDLRNARKLARNRAAQPIVDG